MLVLKDRVLYPDGTTVISEEEACKRLLLHGELKPSVRLEPTLDAYNYDVRYATDVMFDEDLNDVPAPDNQHSPEDVDELLTHLTNSPRWSASDDQLARVEEEIDFFDRTFNIKILLKVRDLISKFKENGEIWGVGRGSSVASLVLFLLEVHDIDPLRYDIPFKELSKEN